MSYRRRNELGVEVVTCDMCGSETENAYESKDGRTHVCYECAVKMHNLAVRKDGKYER